MLVKIKRQKDAKSEPYWQTFKYDGDKSGTISSLLDKINYTDDLYDVDGNPAPRIRWECSCSQKMCGACAMVVNGVPTLACSCFLKDIRSEKITLEPLSKFPVVADLIVDRSIIYENLKKANAYIGTYQAIKGKDYPQLYSAAKCLKCGLCLEVCANYKAGENFFGAMFANESFFLAKQTADRKKEIKKEYENHFASGCSKALSCVNVCPQNIDTLASFKVTGKI